MILDSIQSTLSELNHECAKLTEVTEQFFDDLDLVVHHVELCYANRSSAVSAAGQGMHNMHEFVADELTQIRSLIVKQGQMICQWLGNDIKGQTLAGLRSSMSHPVLPSS